MDAVLTESALRGEASQLDTLETTADVSDPVSYAEYRRNQNLVEFNAAHLLYSHTDDIEGTHRTLTLEECRQNAWFAYNVKTGAVRVVSNACRLRWCPICAAARYQYIRQEVRAYVLSVRKPKFLTLTMRHTDAPLSDQIEALYRHFRLFRQHRFISNLTRGGVWFFQIKLSKKDGNWHPHLHCVLDSDFIDKVKLSDEWRQTTGDSFVVDIRSIKDPGKVVDYVSRYCSKPCRLCDFTPQDQAQIFTVLHGRRLCGAWGSGCSICFRPRRCEDAVDWKRIGDWPHVFLNRHADSLFRHIWLAFTTGQPLDQCFRDEIQREDFLPDVSDCLSGKVLETSKQEIFVFH